MPVGQCHKFFATIKNCFQASCQKLSRTPYPGAPRGDVYQYELATASSSAAEPFEMYLQLV